MTKPPGNVSVINALNYLPVATGNREGFFFDYTCQNIMLIGLRIATRGREELLFLDGEEVMNNADPRAERGKRLPRAPRIPLVSGGSL